MRLAVLKERRASETRVAATPDTVKRLIALGVTVAMETGAGAQAAIPDQEFAAAGATMIYKAPPPEPEDEQDAPEAEASLTIDGEEHPLRGNPVVLGRSKDCEIM